MKNTNVIAIWILIIGLLLIAGFSALAIVLSINNTVRQAQQAIQPVSDMSSNLGTEVARLLHPTPTILPDPITIVHDVRSLSRLETIQYNIEKIITAETGQGSLELLFGDKLIYVAHGSVIAGIDLGKIRSEDLWVQNSVLYVRLPEPEVFVATLDNEKSYVYDRDTGLLTKGDINLESNARQVAEQEITRAALEDGILNQARINGEYFLERLLRDLGYPEVIFEMDTPSP
jgi:hypothetical protein